MLSVRIWFKRQLRVDHLSFPQRQMLKIGTVGVAAVKNRLAAAQGPTDAPAKPLTKRYAIRKTKLGLGNRRNLSFTGNMLRNLQVRTVSEKAAKAGLSTCKDRIKAWANQKIEPWLVFSPRNRAAVVEATRRVARGDEAETGGRVVFRGEYSSEKENAFGIGQRYVVRECPPLNRATSWLWEVEANYEQQ